MDPLKIGLELWEYIKLAGPFSTLVIVVLYVDLLRHYRRQQDKYEVLLERTVKGLTDAATVGEATGALVQQALNLLAITKRGGK